MLFKVKGMRRGMAEPYGAHTRLKVKADHSGS